MPVSRLRLLRLSAIATACLVLAGCQLWPFERQVEEPPAEPPTAQAGEGDKDQADSVTRAVALLQDGEEEAAEKMLVRLLEERPDSSTARLLLAQIRQPPEELLGESFEKIEVRRGDSLSAIAGRTINNELLFYSLARLNDIDVPRLLRPGQRLLVPRLTPSGPGEVEDEAAEAPGETAALSRVDDLRDTAARLIRNERYSQAYSLLLSAARAGKLREPGDALLAQASIALADAACREDEPERALKILNQASPWLGKRAEEGEFARQRDHVEARLLLGEAEQALDRGEHGVAFDNVMAARELTEDLPETHRQRLEALQTALGEHYHDRALSAWRDQQVDRSVELWDRVVRVNPGFEPAIRYLERARRAQQELEILEGG